MTARKFSGTMAAAALLLAGCGGGMPPAGELFQEHNDGVMKPMGAPYGIWNEAPDAAGGADYDAAVEQLDALGYLAGSTEVSAGAAVRRHDPARAFEGLNFYTSGHAPAAILADMEGRPLHEWRFELKAVWPDYPVYKDSPKTGYWRRAYLYPNGDVLAIFEGIGIIKVDQDSNLIWAQQNGAHHDLQVLDDGTIWVLTRAVKQMPEIHERLPTLEDFATELAPDGSTRRSISLLEAAKKSGEIGREFWRRMGSSGDVLHTNSIELLDGRLADQNPAFATGSLLLSMLYPDTIAVLDPVAGEFTWALRGSWRRQHDATVQHDGTLTLFDNRAEAKRTRVIQVDPATGAETVLFGGTDAEPFYTFSCGTAARLPNGNLLATESDGGRALEVAPDGAIVWEFYNPHRAGDQGQYIATLFEVVRLPKDYVQLDLPAPAASP
ncbi:MAG: hypothetical protein GC168_19460 [Candidatus Hydrogenedens sp.]|nr:hypothetical protein [Candidatus Hydrogenedens sp.]